MNGQVWPPGHFHHDHQGGVVIVPAGVAAYLEQLLNLPRVRRERRGLNPAVDSVLADFERAALAWRASAASGSNVDQKAEVAPLSPFVGPGEAAALLGISGRALRYAMKDGRLEARQVNGKRQITRDDIEHFRASRRAQARR